MAIIPQNQLFRWQEINNLGDLERLRLALEYLPDEKLMQTLEKLRDKGTDKYPIRQTWNSIIAGVVYQHVSIESLRRELQRNGQLRELCGFNMIFGIAVVPTPSSYTRFLKNLIKNASLVDEIFDEIVKQIKEVLPDFGKILAFDGKAINSYANGKKRKDVDEIEKSDGRGDDDADWGVKVYTGMNTDGSLWKKVKSWFGYKLHLIVDAAT